jgi:hypothetical protein
MQQFYFLIHKKPPNLDEIRVTKDGFDYCFPRVTKQGYPSSVTFRIKQVVNKLNYPEE